MGKEQHKDNGSMLLCDEGVERADLVVEKAEVKVVGRVDPEKFCCMLHEVTKKHVKIETQSTVSEGGIATSRQTKSRVGQAPSDSFALGTDPESPGRQRNSLSAFPVTPSAPPLPGTCCQTVPSERCAYRWSAPSSTLGMWTASDITGTLAMYEL